jgi:putative DNA primase/helicase
MTSGACEYPGAYDEFVDEPKAERGSSTTNGSDASGSGAGQDWPEPDRRLVEEARIAPPPFDWEAMPPSWRDWIRETAADCGAPPDYVAGNLFGVSSGIIGNVRRVSPWDPWVEHPHLWFADVGKPSSNKTPTIAPFKAAAAEIEALAMPAYKEKMREFHRQETQAKAEQAKYKREVEEAVREGKTASLPPREADEPDEPPPPRLLIADATTEQVAKLLSGNPRGLALVRSELAAWFGLFDKYGGDGGDRGFYLEAWDGNRHMVDRVKFNGRPLQIPYMSLAIIGSIQPDRLAEVFNAADDGLTARFLYLYPEPIPPERRPTVGAKDRIKALADAFGKLRSIDWDHDLDGNPVPLILRLDDDAADVLHAVRTEVYRADQEQSGGMMMSWRGKNPGRLLRLALTFELLEWAKTGGLQPDRISGNMTKRAAAYLAYCTNMMQRVLGELVLSEAQRDAGQLARAILVRTPHLVSINERDVYKSWPGFHSLRKTEHRKEVFAELERAGWIRRSGGPGSQVGRPALDWLVNPKLWKLSS